MHFLELIHFSAGFHTAPIHSFHKLSGRQIYDKLTALSDKLVGISLRSDGDVGDRRLSAENACPRNCEHIGFIYTAAGNESRWQGRGYDVAFHCSLVYFVYSIISRLSRCQVQNYVLVCIFCHSPYKEAESDFQENSSALYKAQAVRETQWQGV